MKPLALHFMAFSVIFLAHSILLAGLMHHVRSSNPVDRTEFFKPFNVFMIVNSDQSPSQLISNAAFNKVTPIQKKIRTQPQDKVTAEVIDPIKPLQSPQSLAHAESEHQGWGTSSWNSNAISSQINGSELIRQSQIARQRAEQVASISAELSTISARLAPLITANIFCTQNAGIQLDCTPVLNENERGLIEQILNLAVQARSLGIAENPVRMRFSDTSGVTIALRQ